MGVAVISGIIEALATPRTKMEQGKKETTEDDLPAPSGRGQLPA